MSVHREGFKEHALHVFDHYSTRLSREIHKNRLRLNCLKSKTVDATENNNANALKKRRGKRAAIMLLRARAREFRCGFI